tara:strand:- start:14301 stop:15098 length:798 start_codon:yes stop_codon:yes gene_type:complete
MSQGNLIRGLSLGKGGNSGDYFIEAASGNIPGTLDDRMVGRRINVASTVMTTLWDHSTNLVYLTADTQLYASSTSALDTDVTILVQGLDSNYIQISRLVTVTGQTQVALSGLMFRVHTAIVLDTSPVGTIYIAESDTLSVGIPTTASKIKSRIRLAPNDSGAYASYNITHNGFFTVPAGKQLNILGIFNTVARADNIQIDIRARSEGGAWLSLNMIWAYESPAPLPYMQRPRIDEKSDIEIRVLASAPNQVIEVNAQFMLIDKVQ